MKVKECYKTAEVWNSNQCLDMMCPIEFILELPGISTKTLTVRLRELEKHGLIHRRVYAEIPPRVEYSLTEKGLELQPVLVALKQVGEQWLKDNHCICPLELTL